MAIRSSNQITFTGQKIEAVAFQIYSLDGLQFTEDITQIELKTVAAIGDTLLSDTTYQWSYLDTVDEENGTETWIDIEGGTTSSLLVAVGDIYAFKTIRCVLTYDGGKVLEDYVTLTQETVVYSATVNFWGSNNIFSSDADYIIAYASLYRNGDEVDALVAQSLYAGNINISEDKTYLTAPEMQDTGATKVYFIYKDQESEKPTYQVILGQYNSETQVWDIIESSYKYKYLNNVSNQDIHSKIVVISKQDVAQTRSINFSVQDENSGELARTTATIFDTNDPIISDVAPNNPKNGQLWLDSENNTLKMWNEQENNWVNAGYQNGGAIYTSMPDSYLKGDLWILAQGEECIRYITNEDGDVVPDVVYGEGSLLKAHTTSSVFQSSHWEEAVPGEYEQRVNIHQFMEFTKENGLQIGEKGNGLSYVPFYVQINSTEMGFYDNEHGNGATKVVHIGSKSAKIKEAKFYNTDEDNVSAVIGDTATFYNAATFQDTVHIKNPSTTSINKGFTWQLETNGSLSLVPIIEQQAETE
jgi:hypothetical protein